MSVDQAADSVLDQLPDLAAIQAAQTRLQASLTETPIIAAPDLATALDRSLWLKAENLQRTGSFKARGALNWLKTASPSELHHGLVTVSAGNHALALAWVAGTMQVPVTVVMPAGSSELKVSATRAYGAEVIVQGTIQEAVELCRCLADQQGLTLVHPYNDPRVMAGQGTVGLELLRQLPDVQRVLCPIGGGGLISGMGIALKALKPEIELIGVEPEGAPTMRNAWDRNDATASLQCIDTIAVSLAPAVVGEYTFAGSRRVVDDVITVSDDAILEATRLVFERAQLCAETGAVVGIAAVLEGKVPKDSRTTAAIITGGNIDPQQLVQILGLNQPESRLDRA